jgi:hypothetical protein
VKTYRKKPVEIEARRWDGSVPEATKIINWVLAGGGTARYREGFPVVLSDGSERPMPASIRIDTPEGVMRANPEDWVIRGVKGEFYPCKPDIFEATYEEVS